LNFTGAGVTVTDGGTQYVVTIPGGGAGAVASVFGRTGAVVATTGDYTAAQVTNAVDQTQTYANPAWITSLAYSKITGAPTPISQSPWTSNIDGAGFNLNSAGAIGIGIAAGAHSITIQDATANSFNILAINTNPAATSGMTLQNDSSDLVQFGLGGSNVGSTAVRRLTFLLSTRDLMFGAGTGFVERMRIVAATGNVGIGLTPNSAYKLDVAGDCNLASGSLYRINGVQHTHAAADITSGVIAPARLGTGTPSASNYLRGDGTWAAVAAGSQTPWTSDIDGGGFTLTNVARIGVNTASISGSRVIAISNAFENGFTHVQNSNTQAASFIVQNDAANLGGFYLYGSQYLDVSLRNVMAVTTANAIPCAFVTGNAERMRITSGGVVAIRNTAATLPDSGTTDPRLIVGSTASNVIPAQVNLVGNVSFADNVLGILSWCNYNIGATDKRLCAIMGVNGDVTGDTGYLTFWTRNAGTPAERMRVTAAGNVGMGVANPIGELMVASTSTTSGTRGITSAQFSNSAHGAIVSAAKYRGSVSSPLVIQAGDYIGGVTFHGYSGSNLVGVADLRVQTESSIDSACFQFLTANLGSLAERMRITAAGNVGINATDPRGRLDVRGGRSNFAANSEKYAVNVAYSYGTSGYWIGGDSGGALCFSDEGGAERMRITAAGNVGIGTTIPGSRLVVTGPSGAQGQAGTAGLVQITTGTGHDTDEKIQIGVVDGGYGWIQAVKAGTAYRPLVLQPSGGNVGIGRSDPPDLLSIMGPNNSGINLRSTSTGIEGRCAMRNVGSATSICLEGSDFPTGFYLGFGALSHGNGIFISGRYTDPANLPLNTWTAQIVDASNQLFIRVKYADGTVKAAVLSLS